MAAVGSAGWLLGWRWFRVSASWPAATYRGHGTTSWVAPTCRTGRPVRCIQITIAAPLEILAGQSDGDESRSGPQSVPTLINRTRGERHDRYLHLRHLFDPRRLR